MTAAEKFAYHMADRVLRDPRVAYHVGPYSRSLELLTEAYAEISGRQLDEVRADFNARIKTERPTCPECTHCTLSSLGVPSSALLPTKTASREAAERAARSLNSVED